LQLLGVTRSHLHELTRFLALGRSLQLLGVTRSHLHELTRFLALGRSLQLLGSYRVVIVKPAPIVNRVTELLGVEYPIVQAPMGYIARAQLASAVSNAGGLGIIETSSGDLDAVRAEIVKMRDLTDKPFGVNIAQLFVRDASIVDFVVDNGVRFVTTSAGDPTTYTTMLKDAGLTVFHVVPSLRGALKAVRAGVDGLVVEGNEGGGFKHPSGASTMVLLPLVCSKVDVPVIAAGGIVDGRSMAASFVLGAEGVQMGTRMLSAAESPVHDKYKQLVVDSTESDTILLNRFAQPAFRVLRTSRSADLERQDAVSLGELGGVLDLYFGGNLGAAFAFGGQVAGRIDSVRPVADIVYETVAELHEALARVARAYPPPGSSDPAAVRGEPGR
jgi:enoyl-[acyl-carrier protein] reductase II